MYTNHMEKIFNIIVACDRNRGIGKDGDLAWHIPEDLRYFQKVTTQTQDPKKQNIVIMGRKTWDSIPNKFRPLKNRQNIVLSRSLNTLPEPNTNVLQNMEDCYTYCQEQLANKSVENCFIIGGGTLYDWALPYSHTLYITQIHETFDCDTFFPEFKDQFKLTKETPTTTENKVPFQFQTHHRQPHFQG